MSGLQPLLTDLTQSSRLRVAALRALLRLDPPQALPHLPLALQDPSDLVHKAAVRDLVHKAALGELDDARAVAPLIAALRDGDAGVRRAAARALGVLGDARALQPLRALLADPNHEVIRETREALAQLESRGHPMSESLENPEGERMP